MKKFISIIISIAILINITPTKAETLCLTGVNDTLISYSYAKEPITYRNEIYAPYTVFTNNLGLNSINQNESLVLYDSNIIVNIDKISGSIIGNLSETKSNIGIFRGTEYYVNVPVICSIFGFKYSYSTGTYKVLRIYSSNISMSNEVFSAYAIAQYEKSLQPAITTPPVTIPNTETPSVSPPTSQTTPNTSSPNTSSPSTQTPSENQNEVSKDDLTENTNEHEENNDDLKTIENIYPVFISNISKENCDYFAHKGTFFVTETSFENADMIRYAYINDLQIGINLSTQKDTQMLKDEISKINDKLFELLGIKTTIIYLQNSSSKELENYGYKIVNINQTSFSKTPTTNLDTLVVQLNSDTSITNLKNYVQENQTKLYSFNIY